MRLRRLPRASALLLTLLAFGLLLGQAQGKRVESKALLWSALNDKVVCGLSIRVQGRPDSLLCFARSIPTPKGADDSIGDPGFVYLKADGRPRRARLSQYSWEKEGGWQSHGRRSLRAGDRWKRKGAGMTCVVRKRLVRCANRARHGFVVRRSSYRAW